MAKWFDADVHNPCPNLTRPRAEQSLRGTFPSVMLTGSKIANEVEGRGKTPQLLTILLLS